MESRTEVVYSQGLHPLMQERIYRNPRHFAGAEAGFSHVYVVGDHPEVVAAYEAAGVPVTWTGVAEVTPGLSAVPVPARFTAVEDPTEVDIPDDWRDLGWPALRRLAQAFSAEPVLNKPMAIAAVEAELIGREGEAVEE